MTYARSQLVPPGAPGTYHCVSRSVRRAFLCGEDRYTGQSFEHRRQWLEDRLHALADLFARRANAEDHCKGRFWEGRFKCQALHDESAVLATMAYVDLNLVRAALCDTLEDAAHTSARGAFDTMRPWPAPARPG